jgi:5'-deoxynucleotidase
MEQRSHFFAYMSRMKFIKRWGLMRNSETETIEGHSLQVAMVAHGLAVIRNRLFDGRVNPERVALLALFHDTGEVITGDLATPIKCFNPKIKDAYHEIEDVARQRLLDMLPEPLQQDYRDLFFARDEDATSWELVKAADKICAYLKCVEERQAGNRAFEKAERTLERRVRDIALPEVDHFMGIYGPSFSLTLDELN